MHLCRCRINTGEFGSESNRFTSIDIFSHYFLSFFSSIISQKDYPSEDSFKNFFDKPQNHQKKHTDLFPLHPNVLALPEM